MPCGHNPSNSTDGRCHKPCGALLSCGCVCKGDCDACHQGRVHKICKEPCHKLLICGHTCEFPCKMLCPPCPQKCDTKCSHKQCTSVCGSPCEPCQVMPYTMFMQDFIVIIDLVRFKYKKT
ncbi:hypothetical protein J6590_090850 [Homalodisca vitripennis]|nr:hypothetical protein J6590_090850 [Homalodisca vitripennis]